MEDYSINQYFFCSFYSGKFMTGQYFHFWGTEMLSFQFTMQFLPDSPPYLVKSSRDSLNSKSDAFKAYVFFSGNVAAAEQEIQKATRSK